MGLSEGSAGKFDDDHFDLNNIFNGFSYSFPQGQNLTKFSICPENVLVSICNNYHQACLLFTINQMSNFSGFYLLFDEFFYFLFFYSLCYMIHNYELDM